MAQQPTSPVDAFMKSAVRAATDGWNQITGTPQAKPAAGVVHSPLAIDVGSLHAFNAAEWSKPFSTGSPNKKPDEDASDFNEFSFWRNAVPLPSEDTKPSDSYNDVNYWKPPQPTLEQLETRGFR